MLSDFQKSSLKQQLRSVSYIRNFILNDDDLDALIIQIDKFLWSISVDLGDESDPVDFSAIVNFRGVLK